MIALIVRREGEIICKDSGQWSVSVSRVPKCEGPGEPGVSLGRCGLPGQMESLGYSLCAGT